MTAGRVRFPLRPTRELASDGSAETLEMILLYWEITDLKDSTRVALERFQTTGALPEARRLVGLFRLLASAQSLSAFQPDGSGLLLQVSDGFCPRFGAGAARDQAGVGGGCT